MGVARPSTEASLGKVPVSNLANDPGKCVAKCRIFSEMRHEKNALTFFEESPDLLRVRPR